MAHKKPETNTSPSAFRVLIKQWSQSLRELRVRHHFVSRVEATSLGELHRLTHLQFVDVRAVSVKYVIDAVQKLPLQVLDIACCLDYLSRPLLNDVNRTLYISDSDLFKLRSLVCLRTLRLLIPRCLSNCSMLSGFYLLAL